MCSQSSTEEGSSGEEAARRRASPAVDVLGGNPQAAQNVSGESPRHAPQPVAAAPCPVPPLTNSSTVPLPENKTAAFLVMESASPTNLPGTVPISFHAKVGISEDAPTEESFTGATSCSPTSLTEDSSTSAELQKPPSPLCPPFPSDKPSDSTVQDLQYGLQTDREKSHSNSDTNRIQPPSEGSGHVVVTETEEKQSVALEYKSKTGTNMEFGSKEHTDRHVIPQSEITGSSPSPQSSVNVKPQEDTTQHRATGQCDGEPLVGQNQSCAPVSGAGEETGAHQDSSTLPLPSSDSGREQTDLSKAESITEMSHNTQNTNTVQSVEMSEHVNVVFVSPTEPPPTEILETPKRTETCPGLRASPGMSMSNSAADGEDSSIQKAGDSSEGEQVASSVREEQTDMLTSDSALQPERSPSSPSSTARPLFDTGLVVSLQTAQVVDAESSHPTTQVAITETPMIAELVHSAQTQEIVVVSEGAHIAGDWTNVHVKQSYLLQREDGSVCQAQIVNELTSEHSSGAPKLYEECVQLDSQPVEVYQFCSLVEEVAEETVCAGGGVQIPHSPAYEMNLFNALLDNSVQYTSKEESHIEPSIHETDIVSNDANPVSTCSNNSSSLAAVGQHLVLDASEICLVEVAADSFTVGQAQTNTQIAAPCSQASAATSDKPLVRGSLETQTVPKTQETEARLLSVVYPVDAGKNTGLEGVENTVNQTAGVRIVSATKPEAGVSSQEETKEPPASLKTPSQKIHSAAVTEGAQPADCISHSVGTINPQLLLLQAGQTPLLKHPSALLAKVSKQQNVTPSSWSGTASQCLPVTTGAADSLCTSLTNQTHCSVNKTSVTGNVTLELNQAQSVTSTSSTSIKALTLRESNAGVTHDTHTQEGSTATASVSPGDPTGQLDSFCEEEGEEMDLDEVLDEAEATSGQVSSPEEGSDDEADNPDSEMSSHNSPHKVCTCVCVCVSH